MGVWEISAVCVWALIWYAIGRRSGFEGGWAFAENLCRTKHGKGE